MKTQYGPSTLQYSKEASINSDFVSVENEPPACNIKENGVVSVASLICDFHFLIVMMDRALYIST